MLKNRLYYAEPECQSFTAQVVKTERDENEKPYVVLDQTAFYPTGGGQPHDTGTINGVPIIDVVEIDGEIRHYLSGEMDASGELDCNINWERRFDHMQQHAGQHILSAAFVELFEFPTVSFHLGTNLVSIDIEADDITDEQLKAAEELANKVILENRPIEVKWVTEDELYQYPLRKQIQATEEIRLVIIPDFDYNGCGGTHPEYTGQVSSLKIVSAEKHRGNTRVHFVCGKRVLNLLHDKTNVVAKASKLLSAPEDGIGKAIEKLLETNHSLEKSLKETQDAILSFESKELLSQQRNGLVTATFQGRSIQQLQKLARFIVAESDETIVLLVARNDDKLQFVAARGSLSTASMKDVSAAVLPLIDGKGGGNDAFVQGGGDYKLTEEELLKMMENSLTASIN
ncbi:alanine--tRNA ligase-related protein [Sporosarcina pasteurii]|uniref:Alanine--tRNA ligase n=1 Tax=Sporosarcina pasteurii TaxID=1474 RepID=A0A380BCF3_SPOPA|nr:alanine--tRNA ligase-related protein [Sporosarcina pasteurii]MDS9472892.1 alanine--tRNA ligase-related protein [Sporosarcina pasteurii]QBQ06440.1 alanyl-tRNA editing protein [Sporosarcina pasteurii]SUI98481.1 Alanine--tRNA ligase [Sporosarcina pasteurii]